MTGSETPPSEAAARVRLDKWLWRARFFRTRTLAAAAASAGRVRVNGARVRKPGHGLKPGDVLTISQGVRAAVVRLRDPGARRGPASEAQALYDDLTAAPADGSASEPPSSAGERD